MLQRLSPEPFGLNLDSGEGRNCVSREKGLKHKVGKTQTEGKLVFKWTCLVEATVSPLQ